MDERFAKLTIREVRCPFCGEWHSSNDLNAEWTNCNVFECYYECKKYHTKFYVEFRRDECYYSIGPGCHMLGQKITGRIPISCIEHTELKNHLGERKPCVSFETKIKVHSSSGYQEDCGYSCHHCKYREKCELYVSYIRNLRNKDLAVDVRFIIGFDKDAYTLTKRECQIEAKETELQKREEVIESKERSLAEREATINRNNQALQKREEVITNREQALQMLCCQMLDNVYEKEKGENPFQESNSNSNLSSTEQAKINI